MSWANRAGIHINRASSAWLIHRYIDHTAALEFVDRPDSVSEDAIPFDMRGVELDHLDGNCTFETRLRRHHLDDPALWRIAAIIHQADVDDEVPGFDIALRGQSMVCSDELASEVTVPQFEDLYEFFRCELFLGRRSS